MSARENLFPQGKLSIRYIDGLYREILGTTLLQITTSEFDPQIMFLK